MNHSERLDDLANLIDARTTPLGEDFSTGCWGAEAARVAGEHGEKPCDYYGFSIDVYQDKIKRNAELPPAQRNREMAAITRQLALRAEA